MILSPPQPTVVTAAPFTILEPVSIPHRQSKKRSNISFKMLIYLPIVLLFSDPDRKIKLAAKLAANVAPKTAGILSLRLDCLAELSTKPEIGLKLKTSLNPYPTLANEITSKHPTLSPLLFPQPIFAN